MKRFLPKALILVTGQTPKVFSGSTWASIYQKQTYRFGARQRNVGWRIDYFLVTEELLPSVQSACILGEVMGSDHCPVELRLDV